MDQISSGLNIRAWKLSRVDPGQYLLGRPPRKSRTTMQKQANKL